MPIANISSANSPGITSYTLLMGEDLPLYFTAAGYFASNVQGANFGIPPQSSIPRGTIWFQAIPNAAAGGTGALSLALVCSLDGGTTYATIGTAVPAVTGGVSLIISFNISGLGGNGKFALVSSAITLGTATGYNVYAHLG